MTTARRERLEREKRKAELEAERNNLDAAMSSEDSVGRASYGGGSAQTYDAFDDVFSGSEKEEEIKAVDPEGKMGVGVKRTTKENVIDVNLGRDQEDIDYDQFKFAVGLKYDLKSQNACFKKIKYITDEVMTELRQKPSTMEF